MTLGRRRHVLAKNTALGFESLAGIDHEIEITGNCHIECGSHNGNVMMKFGGSLFDFIRVCLDEFELLVQHFLVVSLLRGQVERADLGI